MEKQYSWKRTEEIEIDLADLLHRLCMQWKLIIICALVSALIFGGYGWQKGRDAPDSAVSDEAADAVLAEAEDQAAADAVLTEAEDQAVADAVRLKNEISSLETYLDNSILMQLDPYHKARYIMLYCIDCAERQELPKITESYLNFVQNGGAADALAESGSSWKMDKSYLAEVIQAYQKTYSSPYQVVVDSQSDSSMQSEALFYIEVTGRDARKAEKLALDMQTVMEEYAARVKKTAGSHRLSLVSSAENITSDSGLQSQQHDKKALLSSNKTSLRALTDAFSKEQMAVYQVMAGQEDESGQEEPVSGEILTEESSGSGIKYMFSGFIGGIFVYCFIFACLYMFSDTVKGPEEMKRLYTFPVYGGIQMKGMEEQKGDTAVRWQDHYGHTKTQVMNRIGLACKKHKIVKLYAVSDFKLETAEKECIESMSGQFKNWGIDMETAENISMDTTVWEQLSENGNILMVCRMGTTTHRMIDNAMNFYLENGMSVIGAFMFSQNKNK